MCKTHIHLLKNTTLVGKKNIRDLLPFCIIFYRPTGLALWAAMPSMGWCDNALRLLVLLPAVLPSDSWTFAIALKRGVGAAASGHTNNIKRMLISMSIFSKYQQIGPMAQGGEGL